MAKQINVFEGERCYFQSHINEFLIKREETKLTEAFLVIIPSGAETHRQIHPDMEQVFYIISGSGILETGNEKIQKQNITKGDVIYIPIKSFHKILNPNSTSLKYLCVNSFFGEIPERTSLLHAKNVINDYNMNIHWAETIEAPVLVLGASGFIGKAITLKLLKEGETVLAVDNRPFDLEAIPFNLRKNFSFVCMKNSGDLEKHIAKSAVIPKAMLSAIGNNGVRKHLFDLETDEFHSQIQSNLVDVYSYIKVFSKIARDKKRGGCIILLGSVGAQKAHREMCGYDAAKGGLESMCRAMALDLAPYDISINIVEIGPIEDSPSSQADGNYIEALRDLVPIKRYPTIKEITDFLYMLIVRDNLSITGHTITIDGGLSVQLRPLTIERVSDVSRYRAENL